MRKNNVTALPIAVRVYPSTKNEKQSVRSTKPWRCPDAMFVFDTETRIDATQRLTFGSYRFIRSGRCLEEGLLYADDLPATERQILQEYVAAHSADTVREGVQRLQLLTLREFVDKLYRATFKGHALLVGFNLPYDLSRVSCDFTTARGRFAGGFALELWSYFDKAGREQPNPHRPRICIKHIDSKRALKGFSRCHVSAGRKILIVPDEKSPTPDKG